MVLGLTTMVSAQETITRAYPLDAFLSSPLALQNAPRPSAGLGAGNPAGNGLQPSDGVGAGGFGGGGGVFRIPDHILPQFGGVMPLETVASVTPGDILTLLESHLPVNLEDVELSVLGTSLWATTTEQGHQAIERLLTMLGELQKNKRSVQVDLCMVTLSPENSFAFTSATGEEAQSAVTKVAGLNDAAKISIRCDNYSVGSIASGLKRSYIVSTTPVVGGDSPSSRGIGYQPQTQEILLGLTGQVYPRLDQRGTRARIEVILQLTSGAEPEKIEAANYTDGGIIDRVELELSTLETTVAAEANQWTLAGVTPLTNPSSTLIAGESLSHMITVVRWQEIKPSK